MNPQRENPFWTWEDLALFVGALLPCAALALGLMRLVRFPEPGVQAIWFQFVFYLLALGVLYVLISRRYDRPLWRSLGFTVAFHGAWGAVIVGPALAIAVSFLGYALHTPDTSDIPKLITDRPSLIAVLIFAVLIGPVFEELVFRGFLYPLLARSLGITAGVIVTAIPFAVLHYFTYGWTWQTLVLIFFAGIVFGVARARTGSTAAAALVHIGYNGMFFGAYLLQHWNTMSG
jgi:uncharacterized protein